MPALIPDSGSTCQRCSRPLAPGALACDYCHALVHAGEMDRLAAQARSLEAQSRLLEAHDRWLSILPLLPHDSQQAVWIRDHARELERAAPAAQRPEAPGTSKTWAKRLGPLGPIAVMLAKLKPLLLAVPKLKFLFSFATFIGLYWALWGPKFGIGFAALVLIHEMGHYIDIKRRGLPADMPVFFPGLGAYVRWQAMGVSLETRAAVSLAGPLAGWFAAAVCALVWYETGNGLWAALARVGAWFNILNLTPVWIFDGAQAARALRKTECALLLLVSAALGYATKEGLLYVVAAGSMWVLLKTLFVRRAQAPAGITLGLGQSVPVTGSIATAPDDLAPPHESHGIAAYFVAVLTALALILWWVPGRGTGLP
ncbi:MAG TPA: site-2 protease family protein [Candidatus Angelobacter sp.]